MSKNNICQLCFEVVAMPGSNFCKECDDLMDYTFVGKDGHLDLDKALEEIIWLYKEYGKEDNNNLTLGAIGLKNRVLNFIEEIKKLG
jgi:hypothetical protein